MRVNNTFSRLVVALWITVLLNGAVVAAFDQAATQARADHALVQSAALA